MSVGTGKWRQEGVPHGGWVCVGIKDLGEPRAICEMCEVAEIRYEHHMKHPDYNRRLHPNDENSLWVGCICAGHMENNLAAARDREAKFRLAVARRRRWLNRVWRVSASGNDYLNAEGFNVVVYPQGGHWCARIEHRASGRHRMSQLHYPSEDAAKLAALNAMLDMKRRLGA